MAFRRFHVEAWKAPRGYSGAPTGSIANPRGFGFASMRTMTRESEWRNVEKGRNVGLQQVIGRWYGLGQNMISPNVPLPQHLLGSFD